MRRTKLKSKQKKNAKMLGCKHELISLAMAKFTLQMNENETQTRKCE